MLPPGSDGPRSYLCFNCDLGDPMKQPNVQGWLQGELAQASEKINSEK
jgi:hypothetical protein